MIGLFAPSTKVDRVEQYSNLGQSLEASNGLGLLFWPLLLCFLALSTLNDGLGQSSAAFNDFLAFSTKDDQFK